MQRIQRLAPEKSRNEEEWLLIQTQRKWEMPSAPWYKKLWLVRHIRASYRIYRAYKELQNGSAKVNNRHAAKTFWVCHGIWLGKETKP